MRILSPVIVLFSIVTSSVPELGDDANDYRYLVSRVVPIDD